MDVSMGSDDGKEKTRPEQSSAVTVSLHPLVVMNISEHWTRLRAQHVDHRPVQVFGAMLGKQVGRQLELINSFEVKWSDGEDGHAVIDEDFFKTREAQYREVFADLDFLGWYTSGEDAPTNNDLAVHRQFCQIHETPVFLKLDPLSLDTDRLPLAVYESLVDAVDECSVQWQRVTWSLASEQAERIGVEHVAQMSSLAGSSTSSRNRQIAGQIGAINMLCSRLQIIYDYIAAVEENELPRNEAIIREIAQLCQRLPITGTEEFEKEFKKQSNEVKLTAYVVALTRICGSMNELVSKMNVVATERYSSGFAPGGRRSRVLPI